ncbi:isopentenyl-diphosphate Delta-isomerase [Rhodocytophaga rosea]|uniref:Isopentenyl-diphosphate delta-isomerase n=1 Tax=Rhodocytophaga rosea TaxID=2704465 RepID=A0A6C0GCT7_9BACT|nr:isopentenyl-diphosphate Delta-isomerase [Rhodocytophaga rosea]QHT65642.1 isopentenyl-diphosphate Delta-isomerase [Rhodocytophaga rosea]
MSPENRNYVVLVDPQGQAIGVEEKLKAHQKGLLHKAFSIFVWNSKNEMLLQQRNLNKYHFGGLWSNTCCSHPSPDEDLAQAAHRRLQEEMGFYTPLTQAFSFIYKAADPKSKLIEHELDTVFVGIYDGEIRPDLQEIEAYRWVTLDALTQEMAENPEQFTEWFKICLAMMEEKQLLPQI